MPARDDTTRRASIWGRRLGTGVLVGTLSAVILPAVAHADPPAPTNYRTVVVAVEPATDRIEVSIVGGDAFVQLQVERGTSVEVPGYSGEPYLRFRPDGRVDENQASPTYYVNTELFGGDVPAGAEDAPAEWVTVADDGRYSWHDHRTHWMSPSPPVGKRPGDVILESSFAVVVDGAPVTISVRSTWLPAPSRVAPIAGLLAGAGWAMASIVIARTARLLLAVATCAGLALVFGLVAFTSVPAETGPSVTLWLLPAIAVAVSFAGAATRRRWSQWTCTAAAVVAATPLVVWGWLRRDAMWKASIPTDVALWADRAVVGFVLSAGVVWVVVLMVELTRPLRTAPGTVADLDG